MSAVRYSGTIVLKKWPRSKNKEVKIMLKMFLTENFKTAGIIEGNGFDCIALTSEEIKSENVLNDLVKRLKEFDILVDPYETYVEEDEYGIGYYFDQRYGRFIYVDSTELSVRTYAGTNLPTDELRRRGKKIGRERVFPKILKLQYTSFIKNIKAKLKT